MGINRADSVVNKDLKVHDINNLYISGSSSFVTSGYTNPTFTIIQLAIRLAEEINKRNAQYSEESNWFPFVQNVEDILERINFITQKYEDLDNHICEVDGKILNLRKILIKLEIIDDRFVL